MCRAYHQLMTFLYIAMVALSVYGMLYFVIKEAVSAGVKSALDSMDLEARIEDGVERGMELGRKSPALDEDEV